MNDVLYCRYLRELYTDSLCFNRHTENSYRAYGNTMTGIPIQPVRCRMRMHNNRSQPKPKETKVKDQG